jgi:ATP-binding cassette, subfamily B, bacterial
MSMAIASHAPPPTEAAIASHAPPPTEPACDGGHAGQHLSAEGQQVGGAIATDLVSLTVAAVGSHRWLWAGVFLGSLPSVAFQVLEPLLSRAVIDEGILPRDLARLAWLIALLAGLVLLRLVGEIAREYFASCAGASFLAGLRLRLFDHLQQLGQGFFARTDSGALMLRYSGDLTTLESALTHALPTGVRSSLGLVACGALLFAIDWRLALGSLLLVLAVALAPRWLGGAAQRASDGLQQNSASVAALVSDLLAIHPVVRAYGLYGLARARLQHVLGRQSASSRRFGLYSGLLSATVGVGGTSLSVLAIGAGALLVIWGELSLGTLYAYTALLWYVAENIQGLSTLVRPVQQAAGAGRRVQALLDERPEVFDAPDAVDLAPFRNQIEFRDVCFHYAGTSMTLDRVSFRIPRGASVAFVGPSGSGKSTVLNLLMRFCDPSSGSILLDGVDLRRVRQASLRAQMGVVFQDPLLINASVRDNIMLGRPGATDAEVEEAARSAELDAAIATFPQRYHTPAGERGERLSGGQRQRLAIARALVRQPSILILDEATSALDAATESAINDTLRRVSQDRTVVAVTHRLASVVDMDWIIVLDGGHVVEQGTHATLLQQDGAYARLWARQHRVRVDAA